MTNGDKIRQMSDEAFYDQMYFLFRIYGMQFTSTRTGLINWLGMKYNPDDWAWNHGSTQMPNKEEQEDG